MTNTEPAVTQPVGELPKDLEPICVRLADEGVPVRAIARGLKQSTDAVRLTIDEAKEAGVIVYKPKDDWPPGGARDSRVPLWVRDGNTLEDDTIHNCQRMFKVTPLQASMLAVLLIRSEASKDALHQVIQGRSRRREESNPKIVDVIICHLRKRLKPIGLVVHTLWARGYYIEPAQRKFIMDMIEKYVNGDFTVEDLQSMPAAGQMEKGRGKSAD